MKKLPREHVFLDKYLVLQLFFSTASLHGLSNTEASILYHIFDPSSLQDCFETIQGKASLVFLQL